MAILQDLPAEIVLSIVARLRTIDILNLCRVNHFMHDLVTTSSEIELIVEADAADLEVDAHHPDSAAGKRKLLKTSSERWRCGRPSRIRSLEVTFRASGIYDLTSGVYLLGYSDKKTLFYASLWNNEGGGELEWRCASVDHPIIDLGLNLKDHGLVAIVTS